MALFAWSIASFVDGVGITGMLAVLVASFITVECCRLYRNIVGGGLRSHPLFGRNCYIYRSARPSLFQMSSAARNTAADTGEGDGDLDLEQSVNMTMAPTESDIDQARSTQGTEITIG